MTRHFLALVAVTATLAGAGRATGQPVLECDATVQGSISTPLDREFYAVSAGAGERIRIDAVRAAGVEGFVPYWRLLHPSGTHAFDSVSNQPCGNGEFFFARECTVADAATYRVEVSNGGSGLGTYDLRLTRLSAPCEALALPCETAPPHGTSEGISVALDRDLFEFAAQAGERVGIDAARLAGDDAFVPYWRLLHPNGTHAYDSVSNQPCGNGEFFFARECTLAGAATYRVEVSNGGNGSTGTYDLRLTPLSRFCEQAATTTTTTSTTTSTIGAGTCASDAGCGIVLPCDASPSIASCVIPVPVASETVGVAVIAPPSASCRVVLLKLKKAARTMDTVETLVRMKELSAFAKEARKKRRLSKILKGRVDASGRLDVSIPLNAVGKKLLRPKKNGSSREVDGRVLVEVTSSDGQPRLLERLIKLVRQ